MKTGHYLYGNAPTLYNVLSLRPKIVHAE